MRLLISAGEASGEMHGAALLGALRRLAAPEEIECFGLGGEKMRAAGCDTVVDAKDVAVVGLVEVIAHLPRIYREFHRLIEEADRRRPDAAVLIDFPEFNFRLARKLHERGIPVIYYISPQLWAWRKGRLKLVQRYVRKMLVIFPFESDFYRRHGVEAEFVGHPLAGLRPETQDATGVPRRDPKQIALLPGSRRKEIELNLPTMLDAAAMLRANDDKLMFVMPVASTIQREWLEELLNGWRRRNPAAAALPVALAQDARAALGVSRAAVVASGTATLEAGLMGTPLVMVYRLAPLTWLLGRRLVNVPFFCMVNLIAGREVVPELVQWNFTARKVAGRIEALLPDGLERQRMLEGLDEVRARLRGSGEHSAAERAAQAVVEVVNEKRKQSTTPELRIGS